MHACMRFAVSQSHIHCLWDCSHVESFAAFVENTGLFSPKWILQQNALQQAPQPKTTVVKINFIVSAPPLSKDLEEGDEMFCVGSIKALGNWDNDRGKRMVREVSESGCNWTLTQYLPLECEFLFQYVLKDEKGEVIWESGLNQRQKNIDLCMDEASMSMPRSTEAREISVPDSNGSSQANLSWNGDEETHDSRESVHGKLDRISDTHTSSRLSVAPAAKGKKRMSTVRMSLSGFQDCAEPGFKRLVCARMSMSGFQDCSEAGGASTSHGDEESSEPSTSEAQLDDADSTTIKISAEAARDMVFEVDQLERERDQLTRERSLLCEEVRRAVQMLRDQGDCGDSESLRHKARESYCPDGGLIYDSLRGLQLAISSQSRHIDALCAQLSASEGLLVSSREEVSALQEENQQLKDGSSAAQGDLDAARGAMATEVERLRLELAREEGRAGALADERDGLGRKVSELEASDAHLRSELEGQRAAAVALKADLKGKEEQLELAGMKARRLRTVCAAHNRRD